jgi:hypothetical protein
LKRSSSVAPMPRFPGCWVKTTTTWGDAERVVTGK